jgi:nicotinamide riboside kinase
VIFVVTGPESSGKSTLTKALADRLDWPMFPELARAYLQDRAEVDGQSYYRPSDLLTLAAQQQALEETWTFDEHWVLDTDLLTLLIWWQEKYGPAPEAFQLGWAKQARRHYLLCEPDLPWVADPLRENPHDRQRLLQCYRQELIQRNCSFSICSGIGPSRLEGALAAIGQIVGTG